MVLNGPVPITEEAAIELKYEVKGVRVEMVTIVCELGIILCTITPLPVSVMFSVYSIITPFWSSSSGGDQLKVTEEGELIVSIVNICGNPLGTARRGTCRESKRRRLVCCIDLTYTSHTQDVDKGG